LLLLPLVLTACGGPGQPPRSVVLDALTLQIQLTQASIAQALELEAPGSPQVSRVRVEEQQALAIGEARGLKLAGRFDWRLAVPGPRGARPELAAGPARFPGAPGSLAGGSRNRSSARRGCHSIESVLDHLSPAPPRSARRWLTAR